MPFKKVSESTYVSPSGRTYTPKQVRAYYATGGWTRPPGLVKGKIHRTRKIRPPRRRRSS